MIATRRRPARAIALLLATVLMAACGTTPSDGPSASSSPATSPSSTPAASASPDASAPTPVPESVYATIETGVAGLRELAALKPVEHALLSHDELAIKLRADFTADNPAEYVAGTERLYRGLGLMTGPASLSDRYLELLESQVAGFYRPSEQRMYVVSDSGFGGAEKVFYAHEYTHALQDQHFAFFSGADERLDQSDRALAMASLSEGDATLTMTLWATAPGNLTLVELGQLAQVGLDPASQEILDRMPPILTEPLLVPYTAGATLVSQLRADGGWAAVDAAYAAPPQSTEQVLHPDKWAAREAPIEVATPVDVASRMGPGWSIGLEDTLGELQLRIWLRTGRPAGERPAADTGAAGWGGDRAILLDGPDGAWAIALLTEWDSPGEANEFAEQASRTRDAIGLLGTIVHQPRSTTVRILLGSDTATAIRIDDVLGSTGV